MSEGEMQWHNFFNLSPIFCYLKYEAEKERTEKMTNLGSFCDTDFFYTNLSTVRGECVTPFFSLQLVFSDKSDGFLSILPLARSSTILDSYIGVR